MTKLVMFVKKHR